MSQNELGWNRTTVIDDLFFLHCKERDTKACIKGVSWVECGISFMFMDEDSIYLFTNSGSYFKAGLVDIAIKNQLFLEKTLISRAKTCNQTDSGNNCLDQADIESYSTWIKQTIANEDLLVKILDFKGLGRESNNKITLNVELLSLDYDTENACSSRQKEIGIPIELPNFLKHSNRCLPIFNEIESPQNEKRKSCWLSFYNYNQNIYVPNKGCPLSPHKQLRTILNAQSNKSIKQFSSISCDSCFSLLHKAEPECRCYIKADSDVLEPIDAMIYCKENRRNRSLFAIYGDYTSGCNENPALFFIEDGRLLYSTRNKGIVYISDSYRLIGDLQCPTNPSICSKETWVIEDTHTNHFAVAGSIKPDLCIIKHNITNE